MSRNPQQLRDAYVEEAHCMSFDGIVKVHFLSPQTVRDSFAVGKV